MAKIIEKIVQSKYPPKDSNVLWDDGENLKINRNGSFENVSDNTEIKDKLTELEQQVGNREPNGGMGYVILRKDKAFAEQVTIENTIYEIRYDYDLAGASVNIPSRCVLNFVGGLLRNGVVVSDDVVIDSPLVKIFHNVSFDGKARENNIFEVAWFVEKTSSSFDDRIDAHPELQAMFDTRIVNVRFNNDRTYYVSDTLVISHAVNIEGLSYNQRRRNSERTESFPQTPCIFTDKPITIIQYNHPTNDKVDAVSPVNIGGFDLCCIYDYGGEGYVRSDTPLLLINASNEGNLYAPLWGINIDVNICNRLRHVPGNTDVYPNMTGIKFLADGEGSYITYIKMWGYISGVLSGFDTEIKNGAWITNIEDNTDKNWIVQACRCELGESPLFINGTNQCGYNRFKGLSPDVPFVEAGDGAVTLNGTLWDVPVDQVAIKCGYFTNNCPTMMGQVVLRGYNGYNNDYLAGELPEIPFQGKANNILEGLTDNVATPLLNKLLPDPSYNKVNAEAPIKNYDIEVYNSADSSQSISYKGKIAEELNIFNSDYLGKLVVTGGAYQATGYNNLFSKDYGNNTSVRYTFVLSNKFALSHSAYLLTHTSDFQKIRVRVEYRDYTGALVREEVIKEGSISDYYRNFYYAHVGKLEGTEESAYLRSGHSRLIVEYENVLSGTIFPSLGLFNSAYRSVGVSGGNVVGRINLQDVVHTTPSKGGSMNIYYDYNKHYGHSMNLSTTYQRVLRVKTVYETTAKVYFSFRTRGYCNYVEVVGLTANGYISDKDTFVKTDIYKVGSFIYIDVFIKSNKACTIDFGKLFSNYGLEFLNDESTELSGISPTASVELRAESLNFTSDVSTTGNKIVKLTLGGSTFSCLVCHGSVQNRHITAISLGTGLGSSSGRPSTLTAENLLTALSSQGAKDPIAYYDGRNNIIEFTSPQANYETVTVDILQGTLIKVECISASGYDESLHTHYIKGSVITKANAGSSAQRPYFGSVDYGFCYFDATLKKPLWATDGGWYDATGTLVP